MRILPSRKYKSGMGFALWRWTDISMGNEKYLTRLHLIQVPTVGAIMLHWIHSPDPQPDPHDHPVNFISVLLRGTYIEERLRRGPYGDWYNTRHVRRWNIMGEGAIHRITHVFDRPLTLVFAGPKVREWGYYTESGAWIRWQLYHYSPTKEKQNDQPEG